MRVTREFVLPTSYRNPFERVAPGVFTVPGQSVGRVYVLEGADGLTLVDTGLASRSRNLLQVIERAGRQVRDVRRVLLTHVHRDHLGGLRSLQSNADLEVITMAANAGHLQGQIRTVSDGEVVSELFGGLTIIGTPGHLPGHACFWLPERGVLFAGDTLASVGGLGVLPARLQHDADQVKRDVDRLSNLAPSAICCGHGAPVTRDAAARLRAISDALGRDRLDRGPFDGD
jgi:glyoxylase-like metal-dependent hydrolase (beta-lactamase superfamily II)